MCPSITCVLRSSSSWKKLTLDFVRTLRSRTTFPTNSSSHPRSFAGYVPARGRRFTRPAWRARSNAVHGEQMELLFVMDLLHSKRVPRAPSAPLPMALIGAAKCVSVAGVLRSKQQHQRYLFTQFPSVLRDTLLTLAPEMADSFSTEFMLDFPLKVYAGFRLRGGEQRCYAAAKFHGSPRNDDVVLQEYADPYARLLLLFKVFVRGTFRSLAYVRRYSPVDPANPVPAPFSFPLLRETDTFDMVDVSTIRALVEFVPFFPRPGQYFAKYTP